ncbi:hypothetical protein LBMAG52_05800 [Planctomycetia bacterium]|nr:hypothetical protein LBMAG52_05800 [Planctomycetia bacterium]
MLIDRTHKPWFFGSALVLISAASAYWAMEKQSIHGPTGGSVLGLIFGIAGSLLMIFAALLAVRKRLPTWRVGSAQFWLRGHLWLGTLGFVLILFHAGFHWGGLLENLLWISFGLVVVTGFAGVALQQVIPRLLTTRVPLETMVAQIPFLSRTMQFRADQLVAKQAGVLDVDYESLKPFAEEVLKQQRVLKRESDFPKELAKVYANVPLPEADAKKPTAPAAAVETPPAAKAAGGESAVSASTNPNALPAAEPAGEQPAAATPEKKLSPLEQMQAKLAAAKATSVDKTAETHKPLTVEKSAAVEPAATDKPAPPAVKKPSPVVKPTVEKPVAATPKAPVKTAAPVPPALLAELRDFHIRVVRPFLSNGRSPQHRLDDDITARRVFAQLRSDLPAELHDSLHKLEDLCDERRQFNTQLRLHRWLHWWLILHIPPSIAMLVLFVAHVIVSLRVVPFGG